MQSSTQQNTPPKLILDSHFDDMDALGGAVEFDLDFRQIEAGKLNARALLLAGSRNVAMRVEFDRKFHQRGNPPPGIITFGFPDQRSGPLRWNGKEAMAGALVNFNDGRLDGVNPGNFGGFTLSFTEDLLIETARLQGIGLDIFSAIQTVPFWNPRGNAHNTLRSNLRSLERAALSGDKARFHSLAEVFNHELAASVMHIIAQDLNPPARETARFRAAALKRAVNYIDDNDQTNPSVSAICTTVGASVATLERAFAEEFGVSPKTYVQSKRLASVRRDLLGAKPGTLIADIANHWGFWHLGRFASDYRKQFGELPSQTMQHCA